MKLSDIAGYTFNADTYCPGCILDQLPTSEGGRFDGWADLSGQPVETSLSELAAAFSIDRDDECSFDSDEFPKVCLGQSLSDEGDDRCGSCGTELND